MQFDIYSHSSIMWEELFKERVKYHFFVDKQSFHFSQNKLLNTDARDHACTTNFRFKTLVGTAVTCGLTRMNEKKDARGDQIVPTWIQFSSSYDYERQRQLIALMCNVNDLVFL